jgi:hypothetical protein
LDFQTLNIGAHLILLKSLLQAIPLYLFSSSVTSKQIIKKIRNLQRKFLWKGKGAARKWELISWDTFCFPKATSDLVIRELDVLSKVFGAKIWWK